MQSNFEQAYRWVLQHEGGVSAHRLDPGGLTNKGITQRTYDAFRAGLGKPKQSVREIGEDEVAQIYREQYAKPIWFDRLPAGVDYALFDFAVNSGVSRAVKMIQGIVGVRQDGIMGNQTLAAVRALGTESLILTLCDARLAFMRSLKIWRTFGKGWQRRVDAVRKRAMALAADMPVVPVDAVAPATAGEKADGQQSLTGALAMSSRTRAAVAGGVGVALSAVPEAMELAKPAKEAFAFGDYAGVIGTLITALALGYIVYKRVSRVEH